MKNLLRTLLLSLALVSYGVYAAPPENAREIQEHLEFNGYTVEVNDQRMLAKHASKPNISLRKYNAGILLTSTYIGTDEGHNSRRRMIEIANSLNIDAVAARFYIDKDTDLIVEGYYSGVYDKEAFGIYLDKYNLFQAQLGKVDGITSLLK
jgi:hypothetical protein